MKSPSIPSGLFPTHRPLRIPVSSAALWICVGLHALHAQTTGGNNIPPRKDIYEYREITAAPNGTKPLPIKLETYLDWKKKAKGDPETPPDVTDINWSADKGEPEFDPTSGASVELDFAKPFVKENTAAAKKVTVTATYSGSASVEGEPPTKDVERIYLDFWIAETKESEDDALIVRAENAQPTEDDKKVIHWAKVVVKHSAPSALPLQLVSSGNKPLYFYGEVQDPNQLTADPSLTGTLEKEFSTGQWFWIGTDAKGTGQAEFKAKGDAGTGYKDAPEEKTVDLLPVEVVEVIEPEESAGCTGYDKDEKALMVPMQGSNKIKFKIAGAPQEFLQKMKFVAEPAGKLTIAPEVPTAAEQELTLSGTSAALSVKVKLEIVGAKVDLFEADVLKKKDVIVEVREIVDSETKVDVNSPEKDAIENYMKLFEHQANICMSATVTKLEVNYDSNGSKTFNSIPHGHFNFTEKNAVFLSSPKSNNIDYYMFNDLAEIRYNNAWINVAAFYWDEEDVIIGKDSTPKCDVLYIIAHEVGHALGRQGHSSDRDALMADGPSSTCGRKINREDWRLINN